MTHQCVPLARDRQTEQTVNGFLLPSRLAEELLLPIMAHIQSGVQADSSKPSSQNPDCEEIDVQGSTGNPSCRHERVRHEERLSCP